MHRRDRAAEDLTARARIRDAALAQFAEHGIAGATIRGIAAAAGVSSGLVRHHFGSKESLRDACDAYAVDVIIRSKEQAFTNGAGLGFMAEALGTNLPVLRYLARALVDGSTKAAEVFDGMVDYGQQMLFARETPGVSTVDTIDPYAYTAVLTAMQLGLVVLHEHLSRVLGAPIFTPEGYPRLALAMLDAHSHALIEPGLAAMLRDGLDRMTPATTPSHSPTEEGDHR